MVAVVRSVGTVENMEYEVGIRMSQLLDCQVALKRIIKSINPRGMVGWTESFSKLALELFIAISQDVGIFVMFPRMEQGRDVQIVAIISILGQVHYEFGLEINLIMTVLQGSSSESENTK